MKKRVAKVLLLLTSLLLLTGCGGEKNDETKDKKDPVSAELSEFFGTDMDGMFRAEFFKNIPPLMLKESRYGYVEDTGGGYLTLIVYGVNKSTYQDYLKKYEADSFLKYEDNGETGFNDSLYGVTYTKAGQVVHLTYVAQNSSLYISKGDYLNLSSHLVEANVDKEEKAGEGKTKIHVLQTEGKDGHSVLIQLKNGHFIMNDGGWEGEAESIIEYMESLAPDGQKPVIEAWIISHPHGDHANFLKDFQKNASLADRVAVEEVFFTTPSKAQDDVENTGSITEVVDAVISTFKTSKGEATPKCSILPGQKYYYSDMVIDVLYSQELINIAGLEGYKATNDLSPWLLMHIEGQKVLMPFDSEIYIQDAMLMAYGEEFFSDLDVLFVWHHGFDMDSTSAQCFKTKTAIYTGPTTAHEKWVDSVASANKKFQENVTEYFSYGEGTKILTFPYNVGSAQTLPSKYK